jgi:hypothetical protein
MRPLVVRAPSPGAWGWVAWVTQLALEDGLRPTSAILASSTVSGLEVRVELARASDPTPPPSVIRVALAPGAAAADGGATTAVSILAQPWVLPQSIEGKNLGAREQLAKLLREEIAGRLKKDPGTYGIVSVGDSIPFRDVLLVLKSFADAGVQRRVLARARLPDLGTERPLRVVRGAPGAGGAPPPAPGGPAPPVPAAPSVPPAPGDPAPPAPAETASPEPLAFAHRVAALRAKKTRAQDAVTHALRWLAAHQSEDGGWEAAGFDRWCDGKPNTGERPDGLGKALYDVGVTGMALCAFLGAGYTDRGDHEFVRTVRAGLGYLVRAQDDVGCYGARLTKNFVYEHAIATLAMVEAFALSGSALHRVSAQRGLEFIAEARNPYFVWRYGVKPGDNDTSITGWMLSALHAAKLVNAAAERRRQGPPFAVDEEAFDGVRAWLDKMTDPDYGRVGYISRGMGPSRPADLVEKYPNEKSDSMTALAMVARIYLNEDPRKTDVIKKGAFLCSKLLPTWNTHDGSIDMFYWYYGTLAMFQIGGDAWKKWAQAVDTQVVANQRMEGTYCAFKGSWDPEDPWGPDGGRVLSTALCCLLLETPTRYERIFPGK